MFFCVQQVFFKIFCSVAIAQHCAFIQCAPAVGPCPPLGGSLIAVLHAGRRGLDDVTALGLVDVDLGARGIVLDDLCQQLLASGGLCDETIVLDLVGQILSFYGVYPQLYGFLGGDLYARIQGQFMHTVRADAQVFEYLGEGSGHPRFVDLPTYVERYEGD